MTRKPELSEAKPRPVKSIGKRPHPTFLKHLVVTL